MKYLMVYNIYIYDCFLLFLMYEDDGTYDFAPEQV